MTATCTTSFFAPGPVQVAASFKGDSIHRGSATTTALTQTVAVAPSTTSVAVTPNPGQVGDTFNFVATVTRPLRPER